MLHIRDGNTLKGWLEGNVADISQGSTDESESDSETEEMETNPTPAADPTSSSPTSQYGVLVVISEEGGLKASIPLSLNTQSLLNFSVNPFIPQYPHVNFAIVDMNMMTLDSKGALADYLQVSVAPTIILFKRSPKRQSTIPRFHAFAANSRPPTPKPFVEISRYVGDGMSGPRDIALPSEMKRLLESVPKIMVFAGTASNDTTAVSGNAREARLKRFAQQQQQQQQQAPQQPTPQLSQQGIQFTPMDVTPPSSNLPPPSPNTFSSDPSPLQSYDIKYGLKSSQSLLEEEKARNLAFRKKEAERLKREKIAAREERERLRAMIQADKEERRHKNGYKNSTLGAEGYSPATLPKPPTHDVKKKRIEDTRTREEILGDCIRKIGMYRVGAEGGEIYRFLTLVVGNAIEGAGTDGSKYWRLNTLGKGYKGKVKGKNGSRKILETCGFRMQEDGGSLVLQAELWDEGWARVVKRELERASFSFESSVRRALEENANRLERKEPGT